MLLLALLTLTALWGWRVSSTWATWGNLSVDCGRELYAPAMLAEGKTLYRDVYYSYTPGAAYLNSVLFRLFGVRLEVFYWAGSLVVLLCAALLFLAGAHFSAPMAGWTAGAVMILQSFQSWLFCFPLPYSAASVYGCLSACAFLYLTVRAADSSGRAWMFGAGMAAAAALLFKAEIGVACWFLLLLLIFYRATAARSANSFAGDAAAVFPGAALCAAVIAWMVSLGGVEFITQENLMANWPWSYFMRTYASSWVQFAGLSITGPALGAAAEQFAVLAAVMLPLYFFLRRVLPQYPWVTPAIAFLIAGLGFATNSLPWQAEAAFRWVFFPQQMVLIVAAGAAAAVWKFLRAPRGTVSVAPLVLLAFSAILGTRILLGMVPGGFAIYYNGPAILSYLILAQWVATRCSRSPRFAFQAAALLCVGCLVAAWGVVTRTTIPRDRLVPLVTERGSIYISPHLAANYRAAIGFMKEKAARGESVLSVPDDVSLYFLSATHCPVRVLLFAPGFVVPGKMEQEVIRQMEQHNTRYLLWSNRTFEEYGVPVFGRDFNPDLGRYLVTHYHPLGSLLPDDSGGRDWSALVWERNEPAAAP